MEEKIFDSKVERIRDFMKKSHLNQIDLQNKLNIQQASLSKYINGKLPLGEVFLYRLVCMYNINPMWLEYGRGEMFMDENGVEVNAKNDEEIVFLHDEIKTLREDLQTFRNVIADQRKRIAELESQVKNNEYVVARGNVSTNV